MKRALANLYLLNLLAKSVRVLQLVQRAELLDAGMSSAKLLMHWRVKSCHRQSPACNNIFHAPGVVDKERHTVILLVTVQLEDLL